MFNFRIPLAMIPSTGSLATWAIPGVASLVKKKSPALGLPE